MKKALLAVFLFCLVISCQKQATELPNNYPVLSVRKVISKDVQISLKDDVVDIEYIPLETTDDNLISNLLSIQINDEYIFCYNGKTDAVMQFARNGNFIKNISRSGNGPGEYGLISELYIDDKARELYVFQIYGAPMIYSFEGQFLRTDTTLKFAGTMYQLPDGKKSLRGKVMTPASQLSWLVALQNEHGMITDEKNPYPQGLDPEVSFMNEISFTPAGKSALAFTSCNDTIFRVTEDGIQSGYVLKRENPADYYTDVADIMKVRNGSMNTESCIEAYDFFETNNYFYCRVNKDEEFYVLRYNRNNKELVSGKIPEAFLESSQAIPGSNVIGIENDIDNGVPFWPEFYVSENKRAQVVDSYMIESLQERGYLKNMPDVLKDRTDDNPVIIIYTFK